MSVFNDDYTLGETKQDRLLRRAVSWPDVPADKKQAIIKRLAELAESRSTRPREAIASARALIRASKLNLEAEKANTGEPDHRDIVINEEARRVTVRQAHKILEGITGMTNGRPAADG